MIGYMIEQEMGNLLPFEVPFATILTQVEVDGKDPAFQNPTKPIGPVYSSYNLAQFPISQRETLVFTIKVEAKGEPAQTFSFNKEIFPDE